MGGSGRSPFPIPEECYNQGGRGDCGINGNPRPGQIQQNSNGFYQGEVTSTDLNSTQRFNVNTNRGAFIYTGGDGWWDENGR